MALLILDGINFRLWWRSYSEMDSGVFEVVPNDGEVLWEKTDNFVPAIPTAFEQVYAAIARQRNKKSLSSLFTGARADALR